MSVVEDELADWPGPGVSNPRDAAQQEEDQYQDLRKDIANATQQEVGQSLSVIGQVLTTMGTDGWGMIEQFALARQAECLRRLGTGEKAQTLEEIQTLRGELRSISWLLSLKSDMNKQQRLWTERQEAANTWEGDE